MAIDFSSLDATPAKTGKIDFTALGAIPAVGQDEPTNETTALGAAGRGAASMIPMGTQALAATAGALQKEPYLQERQEIEKEMQADIANHPIARVAGQAAGIVAPALVTGGSTAPESLLGAVGQGTAVGAGFGAGNAIDTIASGGSGAKAAGDVALGAGLGAAGGVAGQKLAEALSPVAEKLTNLANTKAVQSANLRPGVLGLPENELQELGQKMHDWNLVAGDTGDRLIKSQVLINHTGDQIGDIGAGARPLADSTPYVQNLLDKAGENSKIDAPEFQQAAKMYTAGANAIKGLSRPSSVEQTSILRPDELGGALRNPVLPSLEQKPITFDELAELKTAFGDQAFDANGDVKNKAAADVYGQIKAAMKDIVDTSPKEYQVAMDNYGTLKDIKSGLLRQLQMEQAQGSQVRGFGLAGRFMAMAGKNPALNLGVGAGLTAMGHPVLGLGALTPAIMNPQAMSTLARSTAEAIPSVAGVLPAAGAQVVGQAIHQNMGETKPVNSQNTIPSGKTNTSATTINVDHPALAPWKPVFQKNAQNAKDAGEVQKANAVTDFILSQRDPAYAAAKQKMADQPMSTEPSNRLPNETRQNPAKMAEGGVVVSPPYTSSEGKTVGEGQKTFSAQKGFPTMGEKLKEFLRSQKEKANGGS